MTDVTGVGIRNPIPQKEKRIATPVCALVRNDMVGATLAVARNRTLIDGRGALTPPWGECEKLPLAKPHILWYHKPVQRKLI